MNYEYEWDPKKRFKNFIKHGIEFSDAIFVFEDDLAITIEDPEHPEERFVTIGSDVYGRILVVVYTYREDAIRIILARKATKNERCIYEGGNKP